MSSEAITRNDLTNILNEVLPPTPSEYRKLLWTNTQGAQTSYTVTADFSEYDEIEIVFDRAGDLITKRMGNSGSATFRIVWLNYIVERTVTISSNTMTIGNGGFYGSYNAGSLTAGSSYAVPTKIYGIKYERVLPPAMDALEWKLKGTASGNTAVDMPTEYNEILLWTQYSSVYFSTIVPRAEVPANGYIYPRAAFYYTSASNAGAYFSVSSSKANLAMFVTDGGTNYTSSATFKLYYR